MADKSKFETMSTGFNTLQSQLEQQLLRSKQLHNEIESLSNNTYPIQQNDNDGTDDYKLQTAASFLSANLVSNCFTDNIIESITSSKKSKNKYADVVFEVYNDKDINNTNEKTMEFYGIRALFAMHSSVFAKILYQDDNIKSNKRQKVVITDKNITSSIFETITFLFYGLNNMKTSITKQNAMNLLYAANKYNIKPLKKSCIDFIVNKMIQKKIEIKILCDIFNRMIELNLNDIFDEIIKKTIIVNSIELNELLISNNEYLLKYLTYKAFDKLLFESTLKQSISAELQWILCLKWSKYKSSNWKVLMKEFKDKIEYISMSGTFFLTKVQPLGILDEQQLVIIMTKFLNTDNTKIASKQQQNTMDLVGFNEYNADLSKVLIYNKITQIITNGKRGCHWIWFGSNNGWNTGKHSFKVKCNGLPQHNTGNIIAMIGATDYQLIKRKNIWNKDECVFDIDFDEESDSDSDTENDDDDDNDDNDDDERKNEDKIEEEVVSISYDWNGYLYKNDKMIVNTGNYWSVNDEITVMIDIDKKDLKFFKNGKDITDIDIVPSEDLTWFPVLQCCGCKGHHYTCNFQ